MGTDLAPRKIFAGPRLKRLRRERRLTQARMADELDVSPSYLNLMESNQRPITVQVTVDGHTHPLARPFMVMLPSEFCVTPIPFQAVPVNV